MCVHGTWGNEQSYACTCDPRHIEVGGFDQGCPVHDIQEVPC